MFHDPSLAAQRPRLSSPGETTQLRLAFILGGAISLLFFAKDFFLSSNGAILGQVYWGRDFINVWTGGHLARSGRVDLLYDLTGYAAFQQSLFGSLGPHNYSYPPPSLLLAAPLSLLPYGAALALWLGATGALFCWAVRPWWPSKAGPQWLAVLTPAALINIWAGHYGFLLGALFLAGWHHLDSRPRLAGLFFGLMLLKPHLAVLVPLVLLIRRDWQAIVSAAATVGLLVLVSGAAFGWAAWYDFLFRTTAVQSAMIASKNAFFQLMTTSTASALIQVGVGKSAAFAVQLLISAAALAGVVVAAFRRAPTRQLAMLVATGTFLLLPYAFNYDMTVVCVGALALFVSRDATPAEERLALLGFLAPQLGMVLAGMSLPLMPALLGGLFAVQLRRALASPGRADPAAATAAHSA